MDSAVYMNEPRHRASDHSASMPAHTADEQLESKSDEVLVSLFQAGDNGVFRLLVERHQERIRNLLYSIFHEPATIDDLAQEVFIKAYEGLGRFRFESSFYTWLYRIAVNRSRDELRKRKVRRFFSFQSLDESEDPEFRERTTVELRTNEAQELVEKGLKALPEKFRLPVILKDLDGFSYEEIAEVLQCELGTVKSRLSRGRAMLRTILKPLLEEAGP
ncbi:MAG: sigma-70 family RNA polymerase sigma factor [Bacteroidota bacterium]